MQAALDFCSVFLFFIAFQFYGIYVATTIGIIASGLQTIIYRLIKKEWDYKQIITFVIFTFFGGLTLYFHNPIFVKWKPTIIFWIFAAIILFSHFFMKKPIMQRLLEPAFEKHQPAIQSLWHRINLAWTCFFILLGSINLYIAYHYSNAAWVNFKFYGILGAVFIFSLLQSIYLAKNMHEKK
jgi:intracellular septation protein